MFISPSRGPGIRCALAFSALAAAFLPGCPQEPVAPEPPAPAPRIVSFEVSPGHVEPGGVVTLSWTVENAVKLELTQAGRGTVSGASLDTRSVEVVVEDDALFVLTVTNDRGVRDTAAAAVDAIDGAQNVLFFASPQKLRAGDPAVLAWRAPGARSVSLASSDGQPVELGGQLETGAVEVLPAADTTWTLTVDGRPYTATVWVAPRVEVFVAAPTSAQPGEPVVLSWKTSGASSVTVSVSGGDLLHTETDAAKVADGSFTFAVPATVDPAAVYTFSLQARGSTAQVATTRDLVVYVAGAPQVRQWSVPTWAREGATFEVTWTSTGADVVEILQDGTVVYSAPSLEDAAQGKAVFPTPAAQSQLQLRARHTRGGEHLSALHTVSPVGAPALSSFTALPQPGIARGGDPVTLAWAVPNARNLRITANGSVSVARVTGVAAESGTLTVYPNQDTVYELSADNTLGEAIAPAQAAVTVGAPAGLLFAPSFVPQGGTTQLTGSTLTGAVPLRALSFMVKDPAGRAFVDISSSGTSLAFVSGDDTVSHMLQLPEPWVLNWNGHEVGGDSLSVSINGWMVFSPAPIAGASIPDAAFPTDEYEPFAIVPFGKDLAADGTSQVYWAIDGTGAQRRLIVQWHDVPFWNQPGKRVTFQVQLYADGEVVFAFANVQGLTSLDKGMIAVVNHDESAGVTPLPAQLNPDGQPVSGDVFALYGEVPLPHPVLASATPVQVRAELANGFMDLSGAPTLLPSGAVVIREAMLKPPAAQPEAQWVEVVNTTAGDLDLEGWELDFGAAGRHTIAGPVAFPAGSTLVLGRTSTSAGAAPVAYAWGTGFDLPADGTPFGLVVGGITHATLDAGAGLPLEGRTIQRGPVDPLMSKFATLTELVCGAPLYTSYAPGLYGTPGAANAPCLGYAVPVTIPGAFEELSTTGGLPLTPVPSDDEGIATAALGVPVRYAGLGYNAVTVNSNGFLTVRPHTCGANNCSPANPATLESTPRPVSGAIAPFWDNLLPNVGGGIYVARRDPGLAPNDGYTVISWENVAAKGATFNLNFQVKFFDTGDVEYHYGTMSGSGTTAAPNVARGSSATTWLESYARGAAHIYNVNSATGPGILPNSGIRFAAQ